MQDFVRQPYPLNPFDKVPAKTPDAFGLIPCMRFGFADIALI